MNLWNCLAIACIGQNYKHLTVVFFVVVKVDPELAEKFAENVWKIACYSTICLVKVKIVLILNNTYV